MLFCRPFSDFGLCGDLWLGILGSRLFGSHGKYATGADDSYNQAMNLPQGNNIFQKKEKIIWGTH